MPTPNLPQPALATLSHERFWEDGWIYERKLDGQRCLAVRTEHGTKLYSRSGRDVTTAFPEIAEALEQQAADDFVVDGEVVAFEGSRTSFARLQPRIHVNSAEKARRSGVAVYFYVFDVLSIDGTDVRDEPLLDRKRRLRQLLTWSGPDPLHAAPGHGRRGMVRRGLPQGLGGPHRQARRRVVRHRADRPLAEVQVRGGPGAGGRRLDRS